MNGNLQKIVLTSNKIEVGAGKTCCRSSKPPRTSWTRTTPGTPSTTLWGDLCPSATSLSRPPFRMLSWMQVNLCQLYWINLLLMFQLPLRPCWLYSDNIIHSISIFNSKGRGQGFPVRDINTGNATGFTFMQVLLVTIHLTQCNGLRNVFFLVFFMLVG